jgi:hypothetical protein
VSRADPLARASTNPIQFKQLYKSRPGFSWHDYCLNTGNERSAYIAHGPPRRPVVLSVFPGAQGGEREPDKEEMMEKNEKLDVLVKGIPVKTHNIFKGLCALHDKTVNEGMIDAMADFIDRYSSGGNGGARETSQAGRVVDRRR